MKKVIIALAGIAVLGVSYVAYPYYSLNRLAHAVGSDDPARLSAYVDWASVRQGLKADLDVLLSDAAAEPAGQNSGRELGQIMLRMLGPKVVETVVADYATPEGLDRLIRSGGAIDMQGAVATTAAAMSGTTTEAQAGVSGTPSALDEDEAAQAADTDSDAKSPAIETRAARFIGPCCMEFEFYDPTRPGMQPLAATLTLQALRWKLTRLKLPPDAMIVAPQTAERPQ